MGSIVVKFSRWQNPMDLGTTHCSAPSKLRQRKMGKIPGPVCKVLSITIGRCYPVSRRFLNQSLNQSSYTGVGAFIPLTNCKALTLAISELGGKPEEKTGYGASLIETCFVPALFCARASPGGK